MDSSTAGWIGILLQGAVTTLQISFGGFVVGLLIGLAVAVAKLTGGPVLASAARTCTTVCRAIPELLLILLLYYAGADAINLVVVALGGKPIEVNAFAAAIAVLGIVQGAYASEVIRASILAIPSGQIEAAKAFGIGRGRMFRRIILPVMLPNALAGISNLWAGVLKESALISVVGYGELLQAGKQAAGSTNQDMKYYLATAAVYLAITLISDVVFRRLERRSSRWMPSVT